MGCGVSKEDRDGQVVESHPPTESAIFRLASIESAHANVPRVSAASEQQEKDLPEQDAAGVTDGE